LLYSRVGAGAGAGAASKFLPEPEPHKNDAAPQHWLSFSLKSVIFNSREDKFFDHKKGKEIALQELREWAIFRKN
jgi:hypothetical protein